jgi:putative ABC transport system permease protein
MLLVGGLVVLVTMMGSVRERTAEIGIFRAVGFRKSHVIRMVLLEAGVVSAVAGVLGYVLGIGGTRAAIPLFSEGHHHVAMSLDPAIAVGALVGAVALGLASSAYPALVAARLDPSEALRAL